VLIGILGLVFGILWLRAPVLADDSTGRKWSGRDYVVDGGARKLPSTDRRSAFHSSASMQQATIS